MEKEDVIEENLDENNEEIVDECEERLYQIDVRLQELLIMLEQIEDKALSEDDEDKYKDEYYKYQEEYDGLVLEKKELIKEQRAKDTSRLNQISVWVLVYGVISIIVSFPLIAGTLWLEFANLMIDLLSGAFTNLKPDTFIYYIIVFLIIFSLPLLINLITWLLYVNLIKSKADKKLYLSCWVIQGLMSLGMIIYMCIKLYGA